MCEWFSIFFENALVSRVKRRFAILSVKLLRSTKDVEMWSGDWADLRRHTSLLGRSAARRSSATPALLTSLAPRLARNSTQSPSAAWSPSTDAWWTRASDAQRLGVREALSARR